MYFPPVSSRCLANTSGGLFKVFFSGGGKISSDNNVSSVLVVLGGGGADKILSNSPRTTELQEMSGDLRNLEHTHRQSSDISLYSGPRSST